MATSEPSPVSDESSSEGLHISEPVNERIAHDQSTAMSPRSALLVHTSLRAHSTEEPVNAIIEPSRIRRRTSASERRRKRERDLANASPSQRNLVRLLIDQEQEASILRKQLYIANQRVESEAKKAQELELANQLATQRYREINENKVVVQREASKAIQDSRLYHLELKNAQKEIERARESLKRIEKERDEAEAAAARARAKARKLRQQQMVAAAREEGRRLGFEAGFEHARQERLLTASKRPASRRNSPPTSQDVVTRPYPPVDSPRQSSIRSPNPQEEDEEAMQTSRLFTTSPQTSLSDLPIRNFPPIDPSVNSPVIPAIPTKLPSTSPLRPFHPPPESSYSSAPHEPSPHEPSPHEPVPHEPVPHEPVPHAPSSPFISTHEAPPQLADRTPSIQRYEIEIPPQEQIAREDVARIFNTKENPNDIIKQMPRDMWVTAEKHREMRGSPPAPYPGPYPPPLLPAPIFPQAKNVQPLSIQPLNIQPINVQPLKLKTVRFPNLAKTRQQAASWYRSLSFRKKHKPVIDPVDEVDAPVQNQETTTPTSATGNQGRDPVPETMSIEDSDSGVHVPPLQPPQSWYMKSAPSSTHTADPRRRPISGVDSSPGLSQFELLFTPHVGTQSVKSGKEGKKLKEKDSYLSVIKEERMSRENTPTADRFLTDEMRASSSRMVSPMTSTISRPNFTALQQRPSYEALGPKSGPIKQRHPLSIVVPDPDERLPPPGVAYSQQGSSSLRPHDNSSAHMHKASQSLERMTSPSDASIGIEVVPPSGIAPDPTQSPPHTGRNHLSPYHTYRPASQSSSRVIPTQSITSLLTSSDKQLEPPPPHTELRPGSRASSRRAENGGLGPTFPSSPLAVSRPKSAMNGAPYGNPIANKSVEDARSARSRTPRARTPIAMPPREMQTSPRPDSVRSSASKKPKSQTNIAVRQQQQTLQHQPSSSALNLVSPVRHSTSRVSLREAGSFSNGFDDNTYLDPAFYPGERPITPFMQRSPMTRDTHLSQTALNVPSRPVSRGTSSALSYV